MKKITKKDFKERCAFHVYGTGHSRTNVIYYDWAVDESAEWRPEFKGFKYALAAKVRSARKNEVFEALYEWVTKYGNHPEPTSLFTRSILLRYAPTDLQRFKPPVALVGFVYGYTTGLNPAAII